MMKVLRWATGAMILALAILAGLRTARNLKRARKANDAADALDATLTDEAIGQAKVQRAKAREAQARASTARIKAANRIKALKAKDENMADIAKRFNKRVRNG